ncbi:RagB/SusD family nutrient uptake outer membrane protein [Chitinophaga rhizophila]|uniref:RagB/SusD family nutrient uptake outer membrane protein n=1 Tax=Chitinophaga rhizophila TaxID=2866212 RepID=A0ABS7G687_9BACT|nr:RagB/SusD family nutrient uptake outer membrane protein [Chitinophaga rhizophila]MBW8683163.1 RagB/SusD family nutrient uptake outer membrane protein [Chitinophaga rhizophila]
MKRIRYTFSRTAVMAMLAAAMLATPSCSKFTELEPINTPSENSAFQSASSIELAMQGVYEAAAVGSYNGDKAAARGYPFGAAAIEQDEMRGEDMLNVAQFYAITYEGTYTPSSANNVNMWNGLYALINQTNVLIKGVQGAGAAGVITPEAAAAYEGEARFLRALAHHELLIHVSFPYADGNGSKPGVPYREKAVTSQADVTEGLSVGRGTVAEAYTKLLADLDYAETNLPATQPKGLSRVSKGAAIALKTRIKQHMQDWDGVIAEGAKLGTDKQPATHFTSPIGGYTLTASPETPFTSFKNNTESVFSVANGPNANGGTNGALPSMFGPADKGARGLVATSPLLYNASFWVEGDLRRTLLQIRQVIGEKYSFNNKYRDYVNKTDYAPIIRYAEVLLNVAEAYARKGNNAQAFLLLNDVRNRSVPADKQFTTPPADLILAILQERRIEFTGEGRRWPDIHRLALDPVYGTNGVPAKLKIGQMKLDGSDYNNVTPPVFPATGGVVAYPYTDFRFLWPIPADEIAANPLLREQQNEGYK